MKGFLVFITSFIILFFIFQTVAGILLTFSYEPPLSEPAVHTAVTSFGNVNYLPFVVSLMSAVIAYAIVHLRRKPQIA
ncbi:hypothetical protein [Halobacillus massiliensis]|uniref:hypothetical protein n=1 Tax=Halobacillus massiliensis TaxID=1926286 RepID=UPI0009E44EAC|nr:hypothetical protein [Halobacillus massiliensis]